MITYDDKVQLTPNANPAINQWRAVDANEVKTEVNSAITSIAAKVPTGRTITIDGVTYDLSDNRSWTTSGGSAVLDWYNVKDNGFIGDGVAVEDAAFNALIAAIPNHAVLYFPTGTYLLSTSIVSTKPFTIIGNGINSFITTANGGIDMIYFNPSSDIGDIRIINIRMRCSQTTPTAGSGLRFSKCERIRFWNLHIDNFYENIRMDNCYNWTLDDSQISGWVDYGLRIENSTAGYYDIGDHSIMGCQFLPSYRDPNGSIYHRNSGGLKVVNTKFNHGGAGPYRADIHYFYDGNQITPDIQFSNCSFENFDVNAIKIQAATIGQMKNVTVTGCHFNLGASASKAVVFNKIQYATVIGNVFTGNGSGSTVAIDVTDSEGIKALNEYTGYSVGNTFVLNGSNTDCIDYSNSVIGPSSVTANSPVVFDGTTGKLVKQGNSIVNWASSLAEVGWSGTPGTLTSYYYDDGVRIHLFVNISGTSDATTTTLELPVAPNAVYGTAGLMIPCHIQNSGTGAVGRAYASGGATTLTIDRDQTGTAWTASGTKTVRLSLTYFK